MYRLYTVYTSNPEDPHQSQSVEFACDSIREWWQQLGQFYYGFAISILLLCDGGGSNSSNYYIFKEDLQKLAGLSIA
ncbi:hypothetical protein H6F44_03495 [Pseudanabaena sp. FACHB-1277]|uniref:Transposase n=1 Tax=Pseudanabaena cinerea FACHB-1277 TaxID=2949581 RepID=A0A926Z6W9_9CYAN|nr:hypothetical protein [Pseudanabaena cinerea FACHB-1277]